MEKLGVVVQLRLTPIVFQELWDEHHFAAVPVWVASVVRSDH